MKKTEYLRRYHYAFSFQMADLLVVLSSQDFNVHGRTLIGAKKTLLGSDTNKALTVAVFDLFNGQLLWRVADLPCRNLDRRCSAVC